MTKVRQHIEFLIENKLSKMSSIIGGVDFDKELKNIQKLNDIILNKDRLNYFEKKYDNLNARLKTIEDEEYVDRLIEVNESRRLFSTSFLRRAEEDYITHLNFLSFNLDDEQIKNTENVIKKYIYAKLLNIFFDNSFDKEKDKNLFTINEYKAKDLIRLNKKTNLPLKAISKVFHLDNSSFIEINKLYNIEIKADLNRETNIKRLELFNKESMEQSQVLF